MVEAQVLARVGFTAGLAESRGTRRGGKRRDACGIVRGHESGSQSPGRRASPGRLERSGRGGGGSRVPQGPRLKNGAVREDRGARHGFKCGVLLRRDGERRRWTAAHRGMIKSPRQFTDRPLVGWNCCQSCCRGDPLRQDPVAACRWLPTGGRGRFAVPPPMTKRLPGEVLSGISRGLGSLCGLAS
jgi:hypothetical protein